MDRFQSSEVEAGMTVILFSPPTYEAARRRPSGPSLVVQVDQLIIVGLCHLTRTYHDAP